jgi:hypothetical protein
MGKECPWGTYGTEDGIEGLNNRLKKEKTLKPFPSFNDAEMEAKQAERWFPKPKGGKK